MSARPARPSDDDASSCDWGGCDGEGVTWRWSGRWPKQWLPVCAAHRAPDEVNEQGRFQCSACMMPTEHASWCPYVRPSTADEVNEPPFKIAVTRPGEVWAQTDGKPIRMAPAPDEVNASPYTDDNGDLPNRLRSLTFGVCQEAADEIDRLRARIDAAFKTIHVLCAQVERDRPVIEAADKWRRGRVTGPMTTPEAAHLIEAIDNYRAPDEVNEETS